MFVSTASLSLVLALISSVLAKPVSFGPYHQHQVLRFSTSTQAERDSLKSLAKELHLDIWSHGATPEFDIRVSPALLSTVQERTLDIPSHVWIDNVQDLVNAEAKHTAENSGKITPETVLDAKTVFADYQDAATYVKFIASLPGTSTFTLPGKTYEKRSITGVTFGSGPKVVVMNGGIHAREWIAPSVVTYFSNFLLSGSSDAKKLLSEFTFHMIPVLNVDGYAYTRAANGDRMWRKNREPNAGNSCVGTDPNRNFPLAWSQPGAESDPCTDDFYGPSSSSSAETTALIKYLSSLKNVVAYWDFHSYSQLWMWPYGYEDTLTPDNDALTAAGNQAVSALSAVSGTQFTAGPIYSTIYQASGTTVDWTYEALHIKYSNAVELRDTGNSGFVLPADQIAPSGDEMVAALVSYLSYVAAH